MTANELVMSVATAASGDRKQLLACLCECLRLVQPYTEIEVLATVQAIERWTRGEATAEEVQLAHAAAVASFTALETSDEDHPDIEVAYAAYKALDAYVAVVADQTDDAYVAIDATIDAVTTADCESDDPDETAFTAAVTIVHEYYPVIAAKAKAEAAYVVYANTDDDDTAAKAAAADAYATADAIWCAAAEAAMSPDLTPSSGMVIAVRPAVRDWSEYVRGSNDAEKFILALETAFGCPESKKLAFLPDDCGSFAKPSEIPDYETVGDDYRNGFYEELWLIVNEIEGR
jgi:hypothetical protein